MPNGGRRGDNKWSWFMDDLCAGRATYLGDPIDSLACEIYQISGDEFAAGIGPEDKKDKIDAIKLETELREKLAALKAKSK